MTTPRFIGSLFVVALLFTVSLAYAAPSCCDPSAAGAPSAAFQPARQFTGQPVMASPVPAPAVQSSRRPVAQAVSGRQNPFPAMVAQAGQAPQRNAAPGLLDCCAAPPMNAPAAPNCCQVPQRIASSGCCAAPGSAGTFQPQAAPAPGQFSGPGCGMGGCGGGGRAVAPISWSQAAQPIGNFTGNQVPSQVRPIPANASAPRQGFGQPGYFGSVSPVMWSLY